MPDEHSFDIVSRVDMQEVSNAVQQAVKEISQRFDFNSLTEILKSKLVKRKVSLKSLNLGKIEKAASDTVRQVVALQQGIPVEKARELVKLVKDLKLKVQSEIQKDQLRVRAKKIDDLQSVITMLKGKDFDFHIEFINYR